MIPAYFTKLFGPDWKTEIAAFIVALSGFVAANPGGIFNKIPWALPIAQYVLVGGIAGGLHVARDGVRSNPPLPPEPQPPIPKPVI